MEGIDHPGLPLRALVLNPGRVKSSAFSVEYQSGLLGGVAVLRGQASIASQKGWKGRLYRNRAPTLKPVDIKAVPYYAWDNREPGEMCVWLRAGG